MTPFELEQQLHPIRTWQDDLKFHYQAILGCGHFVNHERSYQWLVEENIGAHYLETQVLSDSYVRVYFGGLSEVELRVLARLFELSGEDEKANRSLYESFVLDYAKQHPEVDLSDYIASKMHSLHHSECFNKAYQPHYRVIKQQYLAYFDVFIQLECQQPYLIAIDGRCGSGKSTLGKLISEYYDCPLVHMDDFYLPQSMRTKERYATPGGNVHHERVKAEVIEPALRHEPLHYGIFSHEVMDVHHYIDVPTSSHLVVEGSYSLNPSLKDLYDIRIFMTIEPEHQLERILKRNGPVVLEEFKQRWIPLEELYFQNIHPEQWADIQINVTTLFGCETIKK